jgi:ABC-2 type transport system permease protein
MTTLAVMRLELRRLAVRPLAWTLAAFTLAWLAWTYSLLLNNFLNVQIKLAAHAGAPGYTDLVAVPLLGELVYLAFLLVPLLTMTLLAGERRAGTLALLFSAGLPASRIVLGKYLAVLLWLALWLALVLAMPLALSGATHPDWGKLAAASLGIALMLAALAAIGIACSAFTAHSALAAAAALIVGVALWAINRGAQMGGVAGGFINWLAMSTHLQPMLRGLVSTDDMAWFVLLIALALTVATRRLAAERERN